MPTLSRSWLVQVLVAVSLALCARAQPSAVDHDPTAQAYNQASGVTQREPATVRETESPDLYFRVSYQFTYDRVCVYYTTDGTEPAGSFGTPSGSTQVFRNDLNTVSFVVNENNGGVRDWWKATLPAATYGATVKYKLSAWKPFQGGEVFANGGLSYAYTVKIAWPGAGAGQANPAAGYPPVSFWKEEAVIGNTYCAAMLDQNGTYYDFHFPTPGGVQGIGTRNEGYVDGLDTFPPGLPSGWRGQMHLNQAMVGLRVDGTTHWFSNPNGVSYDAVTQSYSSDQTNSVTTTQRLFANGNNIAITQVDFAPAGIGFPIDYNNNPQRHILVKRVLLRNNGSAAKTVGVYFYMDPALNGGDDYDAMFADPGHGAICAYDKTYRVVTGTGTGFTSPNEYNPSTASGYEKNNAVYLAAAMKLLANPGDSTGVLATESWRDTSADNGQGWLGMNVTLAAGVTKEVDIVLVGAHERPIPTTDAIYNTQILPVLDWFSGTSMASHHATTDAYWSNWLNSGTTLDSPDPEYNKLLKRGLLATELHVDGVNGGVIAGFHNGAYPFVWPRDAVYAAVTLARTGHTAEAQGVYTWMRDTTYRDFEGWGRKGFWKQKYSTDGYVIWGAPQIDETAVFPWGLYFQYQMTGDTGLLASYLEQIRDAVQSCTRTSTVDPSRLQFTSYNLMYSNSVWEDSYDTFNYSNANVWRGLDDARKIFTVLGLSSEASDAASKRDLIKGGLDGRLDWNGENTDVSVLGIVYPFGAYGATDARAARVVDRINGTANDTFGNNHPIVNFTGEHQDTINRYWGDSYWNGGPWFLSTLWYGLYYATRADETPWPAVGLTGDIDNHKYRVDLMINRLGPNGLGAEQIAYSSGGNASLLYPGQTDFRLQTAWPNAWESMSTLVDSVMIFLGYSPDAANQTMNFKPKLPEAWGTMTFKNVTLAKAGGGVHSVDVQIDADNADGIYTHTFTNNSGAALTVSTVIRIPAGQSAEFVKRNGVPMDFTLDETLGAVTVSTSLDTGAGATTAIEVTLGVPCRADFNDDAFVDFFDFSDFVTCFEGGACPPGKSADYNGDGFPDFFDFSDFVTDFETGC